MSGGFGLHDGIESHRYIYKRSKNRFKDGSIAICFLSMMLFWTQGQGLLVSPIVLHNCNALKPSVLKLAAFCICTPK